MKTFFIVLFACCLCLVSYLCLWPVPIDPAKFEPMPAPAMEGEFKTNKLLSSAMSIGKFDDHGPESIAIDSNGFIYTGVSDGRILSFKEPLSEPGVFANTGGHPLGLQFDNSDNLLVADAYLGLLSISENGTVKKLVTEAEGLPLLFADDLDISLEGIVYFSDASIYPIDDNFNNELLDGRPHGRLISYDPKTTQVKVLLDSLYFANGVALGPDGSFVLVVETLAYRITRLWLKGPKKGKKDFFIENLPGLPDNITYNGKDEFWVALLSPRNSGLEIMQAKPFLRKVMMRLPQSMIPSPKPVKYGFVLGLDTDGMVRHNLQDPSGDAAFHITSALEKDGSLYLGSLTASSIKEVLVPKLNKLENEH
jgi:sugar lactone lactonase YvrE